MRSSDAPEQHEAPSGNGDAFSTSANSVAALSPSLITRRSGDLPAYELKFLLDENLSQQVEALLRPRMQRDPYANPAVDNAYQITSLYSDTPHWDVFHRVGTHKNRKFRVRRYGDLSTLFLERKTVRETQVRKRRDMINVDELARLAEHRQTSNGFVGQNADWPGHWYAQQIDRLGLAPVCRISYLRWAFVGNSNEEPMRLTFDRNIRGSLINNWSFNAGNHEIELLPGQVVCEFKFKGTLPAPMKAVIQLLTLSPTGVSKYRHCMRAFGLTQPAQTSGNTNA